MKTFVILVVDDSPVTQDTFKGFFSELGCDVKVAGSGEEALAALKNGLIPDLIILDFKLPGMSGPEFFKQIMGDARWKEVPVVPFSSQWSKPKGSGLSQEWLDAYRQFMAEHSSTHVTQPVAKPAGEDAQAFSPQFFHAVISALNSKKAPLPPLLQGAVDYFPEVVPNDYGIKIVARGS